MPFRRRTMNGDNQRVMERTSSLLSISSALSEDVNFIEEDDLSVVLVIYTGGTIGMLRDENKGLVPAKNRFKKTIQNNPTMHDAEFAAKSPVLKQNPELLVLPYVDGMNRVGYEILEYDVLLDSCNMSMDDWTHIAKDIYDNYQKYDGFVILHGTDTLVYTASALSFMLENLGKTVILTGSQVPIFYPVSDGRDNFVSSLLLAGRYIIPEVTIFFGHKLFRGNRTTKISSHTFNAFESYNLPPIATVGTTVDVNERIVLMPSALGNFKVHTSLNQNVGLIRIFPSISTLVVKAALYPPVEGVVIQSYGSGNMPSVRADLLGELQAAASRGVIIVNCTQCSHGAVTDDYETGKQLAKAGVISGRDMTPEAALTKLAYVLSKPEWDLDTKKAVMENSIRGELTSKMPTNYEEHGLVKAIAYSLRSTDNREVKEIQKIIFNSLLSHAIIKQNLAGLQQLKESGADFNATNSDLRTPLHIAASIGSVHIVTYLLLNGSSVYKKDIYGHTPLLDAVRHEHEDVVEILCANGAHLQMQNLGDYICRAASYGQLKKLRLYNTAGAKLDCLNKNGRTPLHEAAQHNQLEVIRYLVEKGVDTLKKDPLGFTAYDIAEALSYKEITTFLTSFNSIA
ncbi:uncharacterized protein LOC106666611 isoform X2 [Cimex lectularius]|uniref:asparaginase n=1 Tax=Cimex lectularius TaxID=79782 RepID=A0A8I6RTI5_CIMLE|nr:uncharacterized protein LOC106666611 isoform X5 [Cimex lectularius]XP_014249393.1 uncharacterized protein LOC106666611 isoform X2 [Cimex lectularius]